MTQVSKHFHRTETRHTFSHRVFQVLAQSSPRTLRFLHQNWQPNLDLLGWQELLSLQLKWHHQHHQRLCLPSFLKLTKSFKYWWPCLDNGSLNDRTAMSLRLSCYVNGIPGWKVPSRYNNLSPKDSRPSIRNASQLLRTVPDCKLKNWYLESELPLMMICRFLQGRLWMQSCSLATTGMYDMVILCR